MDAALDRCVFIAGKGGIYMVPQAVINRVHRWQYLILPHDSVMIDIHLRISLWNRTYFISAIVNYALPSLYAQRSNKIPFILTISGLL